MSSARSEEETVGRAHPEQAFAADSSPQRPGDRAKDGDAAKRTADEARLDDDEMRWPELTETGELPDGVCNHPCVQDFIAVCERGLSSGNLNISLPTPTLEGHSLKKLIVEALDIYGNPGLADTVIEEAELPSVLFAGVELSKLINAGMRAVPPPKRARTALEDGTHTTRVNGRVERRRHVFITPNSTGNPDYDSQHFSLLVRNAIVLSKTGKYYCGNSIGLLHVADDLPKDQLDTHISFPLVLASNKMIDCLGYHPRVG